MILYNVTINVDDDSHDAWLNWMVKEHIPQVIDTGLFQSYRMFKVLSRFDDETGTTYSIQYFLKNMGDFELYQAIYAPALRQQTLDLFGDRFTAFRTVLEEI
ncbi:MAG: DUF4286 family protein [Bacteroidia bacterium]